MTKHNLIDLVLVVILVIVSVVVVGQSNAQGPKDSNVSIEVQPDNQCEIVWIADYINGMTMKRPAHFNNVSCKGIMQYHWVTGESDESLLWFFGPKGDTIILYVYSDQDMSFSVLVDTTGQHVDF